MQKLLIGFGSKARIGKDYAAQQLRAFFDVERVAFADALKTDIGELFAKHGLDLQALLMEPELKEKIRPLLVSYGQTLREFYSDVWVDAALTNREFKHELTIVTDMRFPNEAKRIKAMGGYYIEITSNMPPANETEKLYSPQMEGLADYKITNNFDGKFTTDLVELIHKIKNTE